MPGWIQFELAAALQRLQRSDCQPLQDLHVGQQTESSDFFRQNLVIILLG